MPTKKKQKKVAPKISKTKKSPVKEKAKVTEKSKTKIKAKVASPVEPLALAKVKAAPAPKAGKRKGPMRQKSVVPQISPEIQKLASKWASLFRKSETIQSATYAMNRTFEAKTAIQHKILGWGYILSNTNDRLEVLFKDGIRNLISNYKP